MTFNDLQIKTDLFGVVIVFEKQDLVFFYSVNFEF